ncbi:MAG: type IV pilus assembly protein PilM [Candidatus Pacebacteria bacterium]|nr:type IV pilus assembly protein PilM [Candidatus Paceibacterota bacterium]
MFGKFFSGTFKNDRANRVVGIDIGSSSIKVVEVQENGGALSLTTYGELQLGPYANQDIGQSVVLDAKQEQQALVDVVRESAVKANKAVFAMPLSSSFVTMIDFEADIKEDISSRVRVEARKYIPVPISEVTLDWAEIESENNTNQKHRNVLVAAIQNQALNRFKTLMQFANLKEPPTEIECFSAIRGVYDEKEENMAVIDIGAVSTKLYIAHKGLLRRMHRVRAGGAIATKRIASALELSFEEAEIKKRLIKKDDADFREVARFHDSSYDRTWQEFRQVIKEYEDSASIKLDKVYITGGGSIFPTTKILVQDILRKEVVVVNAFSKVSYPAFMQDIIFELNPAFHVALGAALRMFE